MLHMSVAHMFVWSVNNSGLRATSLSGFTVLRQFVAWDPPLNFRTLDKWKRTTWEHLTWNLHENSLIAWVYLPQHCRRLSIHRWSRQVLDINCEQKSFLGQLLWLSGFTEDGLCVQRWKTWDLRLHLACWHWKNAGSDVVLRRGRLLAF